jgi:hypothetical protein
MNRYNFNEAEAQAYYHLEQAQEAFKEMVVSGTSTMRKSAFTMFLFPHFTTLRNEIIHRAWQRDHPNEKAE